MSTQIIYVLNANGEPLMPTHRLGMVRCWLNCGEAHWFGNSRTAIQFDRPVGNTTQNCIEGVDLGNHIGISVVYTTTNQELYNGISQRDYQGEVKRNKKFLTQTVGFRRLFFSTIHGTFVHLLCLLVTRLLGLNAG